MYFSSKMPSLDEHSRQISAETPFDVSVSSDPSLLHLQVAICQRKGRLKCRGSELGIAFIHMHNTPSKSRQNPLPLAGCVCGANP